MCIILFCWEILWRLLMQTQRYALVVLQRAIEEGADFIESDILATKDGHLICFHDVILDATTDIANRTEFSNRKRTYEVERQNVTGWFVGMRTQFFFVAICSICFCYLILRVTFELVCSQWILLLKNSSHWGWNNATISGTNITMVWIDLSSCLQFIAFFCLR